MSGSEWDVSLQQRARLLNGGLGQEAAKEAKIAAPQRPKPAVAMAIERQQDAVIELRNVVTALRQRLADVSSAPSPANKAQGVQAPGVCAVVAAIETNRAGISEACDELRDILERLEV